MFHELRKVGTSRGLIHGLRRWRAQERSERKAGGAKTNRMRQHVQDSKANYGEVGTALPASLLRLDPARLDEFRPPSFILVDEIGICFRRTRRDLGAVERELLFDLVGGERRPQRLIEPIDHGARSAG